MFGRDAGLWIVYRVELMFAHRALVPCVDLLPVCHQWVESDWSNRVLIGALEPLCSIHTHTLPSVDGRCSIIIEVNAIV